jgi:hypothetical protein
MKRYLFIFIIILIAINAGAQNTKQEVVASAGGYDVNGDLSISWTLGETIIPTFQNGDLILTHGFQQQLVITTVEENFEFLVNVTVYPNPASDIVNIQFESPVEGDVDLTVINSQGKVVKADIIESATLDKQINFQDLPAGIYYLRLHKGNLINVYKVVKL